MGLSQRDIDEIAEQYLRRKERDPLSVYCPYPLQKKFHESQVHKTLFIAGNGAGKSYTGEREVAMATTGRHFIKDKYPPVTRGRIGGERPALENEIIPALHKLLDPYLVGKPKKNSIGMEYQWKLKNGSYFDILTYGQEDKMWESVSLDWMWFDEPFPESIWDASISRMRRGTGGHIFITMTPLMGSAWMMERLIRPFESEESKDIEVIYASIWDNCIDNGGYLTKEAIDRMIADYDEELMEARIYGKFVVMRDIVHPKFDANIHVLDPEITPERVQAEGMQVYTVLDPHQNKPPAWGIYAVDQHNTYYVLDEFPSYFDGFYKGLYYNKLKSCKLTFSDLVKIFHDKEQYWCGDKISVKKRFIDPRFGKNQLPNSRRTVMEEFSHAAREQGFSMRFTQAVVGGDTGVGEISSGLHIINNMLRHEEDTTIMPSLFLNVRCANHVRALQYLRVMRRSGKAAEGRSPSEELLDEYKDFDDLLRYLVKSVKGFKTQVILDRDSYVYNPASAITGY